MAETQFVSVEVSRETWRRVKAQASLEGRQVRDVVGNALRLYLAQGASGVVPSEDLVSPRAVLVDLVPGSQAEKKARALAALGGAVVTGADLLLGKRPENAAVVVREPVADLSQTARERERAAAARRAHLRTHPEEESQAGEDEIF